MDDPKWLRIIIIGLVLAALAVGYYLLTGAFSLNKASKTQVQNNKTQQIAANPTLLPSANPPTPSPKPIATPTPQSAYDRITARNQGQVQTLPNTGFPVELFGALSVSVMIVGLGLRKFPN